VVSLAALQTIIDGVDVGLGGFVEIEGESSPFTVVYARETRIVEILLDSEGRIYQLFFFKPGEEPTTLPTP